MAKKGINIDTGTILAIGAGIAVIWGLTGLKGLLNKLGITDSQDTRDLDQEASNPYSPWSPLFWNQGPSGTKLLNVATMQNMYDTLQSAWGYFDDDEEKAIGVIKGLKTQSQLSFFADWLQKTKSIDLFDYMRGGAYWNRLEDSDMNELTQYIKQLPKYK
jgi:hypothetical protein